MVYRAEYVSGEPTTSAETPRVEWVAVKDIDNLRMDRSQRDRIRWAVSQRRTWIDPVASDLPPASLQRKDRAQLHTQSFAG